MDESIPKEILVDFLLYFAIMYLMSTEDIMISLMRNAPYKMPDNVPAKPSGALQYISEENEPPDFSVLNDIAEEQRQTRIYDGEEVMCDPTSPHSPVPLRSSELQNHVHNASVILEKRDRIVGKTGAFISKASMYQFAAGTFISLIGAPAIGIPLAVASLGIKFTNDKITKGSKDKFAKAKLALDVCASEKTTAEYVTNACNILRDTERHVKYWENTRGIGSTAISFFVGKIAVLAEIALLLNDGRKNLGIGVTEDDANSKTLCHALNNIESLLGIQRVPQPSIISRLIPRRNLS